MSSCPQEQRVEHKVMIGGRHKSQGEFFYGEDCMENVSLGCHIRLPGTPGRRILGRERGDHVSNLGALKVFKFRISNCRCLICRHMELWNDASKTPLSLLLIRVAASRHLACLTEIGAALALNHGNQHLFSAHCELDLYPGDLHMWLLSGLPNLERCYFLHFKDSLDTEA